MDENLLTSRTSKCFVAHFFIVMTCSALIGIVNASIDFAGDFKRQCSALLFFFGALQVFKVKKS